MIDLLSLSNIEATVYRIAMIGYQPITVASVYLSPNKHIVKRDVETPLILGKSVFLAGDLNAKQ